MKPYYYIEKDWWYFGGELSRFEKANLRGLGNIKKNVANNEYYYKPKEGEALLAKEFVEEYGFEEIDPFTLRRDNSKIPSVPVEELLSLDDVKDLCLSLELNKPPRNYQLKFIWYAANRGNCINGSDAGTGKTISIIYLVEMLDYFPCMVVCPASVKSTWKREWNAVNPTRKVEIVTSKTKELSEADVYVINYNILGKKSQKADGKEFIEMKIPNFKKLRLMSLIGDEIHFLKNNKSVRSKSFRKLRNRSNLTIGLSGTLILNKPAELINILGLIGRMDEVGKDWDYFTERYCNRKMTPFGMDTTGASNIEELNEKMKETCYFRVAKRDVLAELPPLQDIYVECDISNEKIYERAESNFIQYLQDTGSSEEKIDNALRAEQLVRVNELSKLSVEGKLSFIKEYITEWLDANQEENLLVFGSRTEYLKSLNESFPDSLLITGQTLPNAREKRLTDFKTRKKRLLFANMECIGTGVDGLQHACSNMFIYEFPARPTDLEQVVSRLERDGQTNPITIHYLLSERTLDKRLWGMLKHKKVITDKVNKGYDDDTSLILINSYTHD